MAVHAEEPDVEEAVAIMSSSVFMCPGMGPRMAVLVGQAGEAAQGVAVGDARTRDVPCSLWTLELPVFAGLGSPVL